MVMVRAYRGVRLGLGLACDSTWAEKTIAHRYVDDEDGWVPLLVQSNGVLHLPLAGLSP